MKVCRFERLKGKAWITAYRNADTLTKIAMLSHALFVHGIANYNYGYLSYLHKEQFNKYLELQNEVIKIEKNMPE